MSTVATAESDQDNSKVKKAKDGILRAIGRKRPSSSSSTRLSKKDVRRLRSARDEIARQIAEINALGAKCTDSAQIEALEVAHRGLKVAAQTIQAIIEGGNPSPEDVQWAATQAEEISGDTKIIVDTLRDQVKRHQITLHGEDGQSGLVDDVKKLMSDLYEDGARNFATKSDVTEAITAATTDDEGEPRFATRHDLREYDAALRRDVDGDKVTFGLPAQVNDHESRLDDHKGRLEKLEKSSGNSSDVIKALMVAGAVGLLTFVVMFLISVFLLTGPTYAAESGLFWSAIAFFLTFLVSLLLFGRSKNGDSTSKKQKNNNGRFRRNNTSDSDTNQD